MIKLTKRKQDQHVYKFAGDEKKNFILLEDDGAVGEFNRAQRGVFNFLESYPIFIGFVISAGSIFIFFIN